VNKLFGAGPNNNWPDGTLILTSPAGHTHVTTPGSALLFPSLCYPVAGLPTPDTDPPPEDRCADRSAMMPNRRRTRAHDRATRIATERQANHRDRMARTAEPAPPTTLFIGSAGQAASRELPESASLYGASI
jgi:hypothetical protein